MGDRPAHTDEKETEMAHPCKHSNAYVVYQSPGGGVVTWRCSDCGYQWSTA